MTPAEAMSEIEEGRALVRWRVAEEKYDRYARMDSLELVCLTQGSSNPVISVWPCCYMTDAGSSLMLFTYCAKSVRDDRSAVIPIGKLRVGESVTVAHSVRPVRKSGDADADFILSGVRKNLDGSPERSLSVLEPKAFIKVTNPDRVSPSRDPDLERDLARLKSSSKETSDSAFRRSIKLFGQDQSSDYPIIPFCLLHGVGLYLVDYDTMPKYTMNIPIDRLDGRHGDAEIATNLIREFRAHVCKRSYR